ncbi:ABC transporter ATP-binding protein [Paenibacillus tengchongensis]|uniref:ABC transporter ATP-binding protein n=1 Tax=Paenibacillus tengchongensis TaxID=2608684 RepID=UPI00124F363E|nr:ABC transporter ATP-binding protein [Paenibacillus tengchongensis]
MKKSLHNRADAAMNQAAGPHIFRRLLKLAKPYWGWYVLLCLLSLVNSVTQVGLAELLRRIINAATKQEMSLFSSITVLAFVILIADATASFLRMYITGALDAKSTSRLQVSMLGKLMKVSFKNLDRYHSADLISRINDSAAAAQHGINQKTIEMFGYVMQVALLIMYLLSLQPALTAGTLVICLLVPLVMLPFSSRMRSLYKERQQIEADQQMFVQDTVQGAEVVRAFSLAPKLQRQYSERVQQYLRVHKRLTRLEAIGYNLPFTVVLGGLLFVLSYGGYLVIGGSLDVGAVAAFLICFEQISGPLSKLSNLWTELQTSLAQGSRMFELLDLEEEPAASEESRNAQTSATPNETETEYTRGYIQLKSVGFGYSGEQVLKNISLAIHPGKVTAFAGPSGSGKSTLLQLLLRVYPPDEGVIRCGGQDFAAIPLPEWRRQLAYVSQEPYLFSGTLYDNIAWGNPSAGREEVMEAAQNAGIHDFIMSTTRQYETVIGERGITLSGGERQRLSMARAFVRQPKLLLLDEPTAALDSYNEKIVQQALRKLMHGRTTVVIAHRLSTIQDADMIYYVGQGTITEAGTHQELIARQGHYYSMVESMTKLQPAEELREEAL